MRRGRGEAGKCVQDLGLWMLEAGHKDSGSEGPRSDGDGNGCQHHARPSG